MFFFFYIYYTQSPERDKNNGNMNADDINNDITAKRRILSNIFERADF